MTLAERACHSAAEVDPEMLVVGPIEVSADRYLVLVSGRALPPLPLGQFRLLTALARQAGRILSYADAAAAALPHQPCRDPRRRTGALVSGLRRRLGGDAGALLRNVRGFGYVLDATPVAPSRCRDSHRHRREQPPRPRS